MAKWKPGERPEGAGRPKGTPNKKTVEFLQIMQEQDFVPGEEFIKLYRRQMKIYELRRKNKNIPGMVEVLSNASTTLNNICQYVYPKKKAVEHTGEVGVRTFSDFMAAAKGSK